MLLQQLARLDRAGRQLARAIQLDRREMRLRQGRGAIGFLRRLKEIDQRVSGAHPGSGFEMDSNHPARHFGCQHHLANRPQRADGF